MCVLYIYNCVHVCMDVFCISDNTKSTYLRKGEARPGVQAVGNQVSAALSTSFLVLIGIFFPSVTGNGVVCVM